MQWWAYAFPEAHWDFATGHRNLNFKNNINCVGKDHLKVFKISLIRIAWQKCKVLIVPLTSTLTQKPEQARKGRGTPPHCQSGKMQGGTCSVYCEWQSERLIADPRSGPSRTLFTCFSSPSSLSHVLWEKHSYLQFQRWPCSASHRTFHFSKVFDSEQSCDLRGRSPPRDQGESLDSCQDAGLDGDSHPDGENLYHLSAPWEGEPNLLSANDAEGLTQMQSNCIFHENVEPLAQ